MCTLYCDNRHNSFKTFIEKLRRKGKFRNSIFGGIYKSAILKAFGHIYGFQNINGCSLKNTSWGYILTVVYLLFIVLNFLKLLS